MNAITPSLSAALSLQPQQNQLTQKAELKMEEKPSAQSSNSGNSTVTLSEDALAKTSQQQALNTAQTVQQPIATENRSVEANQLSSGLTYASNLQNNLNYSASQEKSEDLTETLSE